MAPFSGLAGSKEDPSGSLPMQYSKVNAIPPLFVFVHEVLARLAFSFMGLIIMRISNREVSQTLSTNIPYDVL